MGTVVNDLFDYTYGQKKILLKENPGMNGVFS